MRLLLLNDTLQTATYKINPLTKRQIFINLVILIQGIIAIYIYKWRVITRIVNPNLVMSTEAFIVDANQFFKEVLYHYGLYIILCHKSNT